MPKQHGRSCATWTQCASSPALYPSRWRSDHTTGLAKSFSAGATLIMGHCIMAR